MNRRWPTERALDSLPATHSEREARLRDALRWAIEIMPSPVVTSTIADSSTPTLICGLCFARQTEMEKEVPHLSNCRYALAIAALAETGKGESE